MEESHWLAKATMGQYFIDLIYGIGNGVALIDDGWICHSKPGILAACRVQISPPEVSSISSITQTSRMFQFQGYLF
ncbi:MAG: hypothetical protein ABJC89_08280 [Acidobacteriota bacterium]